MTPKVVEIIRTAIVGQSTLPQTDIFSAGVASDSAMAKRKLQFVNYDNIQEELASANVHGVVTHVSPVKKSKTGKPYFHGQLSDGVNTLRFFGFAPNQQQVLKNFRINRTSLEMCNCQVKSRRETLLK